MSFSAGMSGATPRKNPKGTNLPGGGDRVVSACGGWNAASEGARNRVEKAVCLWTPADSHVTKEMWTALEWPSGDRDLILPEGEQQTADRAALDGLPAVEARVASDQRERKSPRRQ